MISVYSLWLETILRKVILTVVELLPLWSIGRRERERKRDSERPTG